MKNMLNFKAHSKEELMDILQSGKICTGIKRKEALHII